MYFVFKYFCHFFRKSGAKIASRKNFGSFAMKASKIPNSLPADSAGSLKQWNFTRFPRS
jgi:hypothetical protein